MENKTITRIANFNNVILTGCVADEKNIHKNEKGDFAAFRFAHNIGGDDNKKTVWVKVKAFNNEKKPLDLALIAKGAKLKIEGHFSMDEFTRKDGTPGSELVIIASKLEANNPVTYQQVNGDKAENPLNELEF